MRCWLTEKPDAARMLAQALGRTDDPAPAGAIATRDGFVVSAIGHLLELESPQENNPDWKQWDLDRLPMVPEQWRLRPQAKTSMHLERLARALTQATEIVIATDAAREGELIAYEVLDYAGVAERATLRLWTTALNPTALARAIAHLKPATETRPLAVAGAIRQKADWLEGMNLSRVATLRWRDAGVLSLGRVQTPALAVLAKTERERRNFTVSAFYTLVARVEVEGSPRATRMTHEPSPRETDRAKMQAKLEQAKGARGPMRVKQRTRRQAPPPPLELATLQHEANRRFGWNVQKTLEIAQRLYETHHAITYPRTDADAYDPTDEASALDALEALGAIPGPWSDHLPTRADAIVRPQVFSAAKLKGKDHHALRPTDEVPPLDGEDARLFTLVAARFAACFAPDWVYEETELAFDANGVPFTTKGRVTTTPGWRAILAPAKTKTKGKEEDETPDPHETDDVSLAPVEDGTPATARDVTMDSGRTRPPQRWTEGRLILEMKRTKIGTKATQAAVIEKLKTRGYARTQGKHLAPTPKGEALIDWVEKHWATLATPAATAALEERLERVERGEADADATLAALTEHTLEGVRTLKTAPPGHLPDLIGHYRFAAHPTVPGAWTVHAVLANDTPTPPEGTEVQVERKDKPPVARRLGPCLEEETLDDTARRLIFALPGADPARGHWRFVKRDDGSFAVRTRLGPDDPTPAPGAEISVERRDQPALPRRLGERIEEVVHDDGTRDVAFTVVAEPVAQPPDAPGAWRFVRRPDDVFAVHAVLAPGEAVPEENTEITVERKGKPAVRRRVGAPLEHTTRPDGARHVVLALARATPPRAAGATTGWRFFRVEDKSYGVRAVLALDAPVPKPGDRVTVTRRDATESTVVLAKRLRNREEGDGTRTVEFAVQRTHDPGAKRRVV